MKKGKGRLFVVSAPSGAGKTTIVNGTLKKLSDMRRSVSWTTRKPRKGESNGRDYVFVTVNEFQKLIKSKGFIEWANVFGKYYGTPRFNITDAKSDGVDLFLVIDVQGANKIRKRVKNAVFVFILPPSMAELEKRMKKRGKDTQGEIKKRLKEAKREISQSKDYNYIIINDKLQEAISQLIAIVKEERKKKNNRK